MEAKAESLGDFSALVVDYGKTFLGGQTNSSTRRDTRINVWKQVINDVVEPAEKEVFSPLKRSLIWAQSVDKVCVRCNEIVEYKDYHAGHKTPKALGGKPVLANGQVEHARCNQQVGATS